MNAGPRLRPLTKSKPGNKSRPKSLNLTTAQLFESTDAISSKAADPSAATTPSTAVDLQTPVSAVAKPRYAVEDLRRRLYCSEECYNVDLKGEKFDIYRPPSPSFQPSPVPRSPAATQNPFEVKRNLSCEMPWLWTNAALPRRMIPTRNSSWLDSGEESEYGNQYHNPEMEAAWPSFPRRKSGPIGAAPFKPLLERRQSKPLEPKEVDALRKMTPSFNGSRRATIMVPLESPADSSGSSSEFCRLDSARSLPTGAPMRKARPLFEDEKNEHTLFFRRMPGKVDAAPVTMPPLFVVDGQWTEVPPPGFDHTAFTASREKERRRRQLEITEALLLKKKVDDIGGTDEVSHRHHETSRRKKHVHAEKGQQERRHSSIHGPGYYDNPRPGKQHQPWWHVDQREDWKAYWAARDDGLEDTTFEQWQLQRHAERVRRVEREQALKRLEDDKMRVQKEVANRKSGDGRKVAKRPLLIRVASQPTISDINLIGKAYEETERTVQQVQERKATLARNTSSSSEASPLGMNRTKALPFIRQSVESMDEPKRTASPSSFMRGQTLCIPGFEVNQNQPGDAYAENTAASEFVFPASPNAIMTSAITAPEPTTPSNAVLCNPPGLSKPESVGSRPQVKKSSTLPLEASTPTASIDAIATLSPRRRVQSLKSLSLTVPDPLKVEDMKRASLLIPRSPLGLHSISAAELPPQETRGRPSSTTGSKSASSVSRSSTSRSKQDEPRSGSHRRTLVPCVSDAKAAASLSPVYGVSSQQTLTLALQGLPNDVLSGSPEVVTAISGTGSGSGSSGEESSWSRAEMRLCRKSTVKGENFPTIEIIRISYPLTASSTMRLPRTARGLIFTEARPKSMGPLEPTEPAKEPATTTGDTSNEPEVASPLSYSAFLLRYYSEFRNSGVLTGSKPDTRAISDGSEQESRAGKRRSLWGILGQ